MPAIGRRAFLHGSCAATSRLLVPAPLALPAVPPDRWERRPDGLFAPRLGLAGVGRAGAEAASMVASQLQRSLSRPAGGQRWACIDTIGPLEFDLAVLLADPKSKSEVREIEVALERCILADLPVLCLATSRSLLKDADRRCRAETSSRRYHRIAPQPRGLVVQLEPDFSCDWAHPAMRDPANAELLACAGWAVAASLVVPCLIGFDFWDLWLALSRMRTARVLGISLPEPPCCDGWPTGRSNLCLGGEAEIASVFAYIEPGRPTVPLVASIAEAFRATLGPDAVVTWTAPVEPLTASGTIEVTALLGQA